MFTLDARHVGSVFADDANSAKTALAEKYTLLGVAARFEQTSGVWTWREFIRIDNVTDRKHVGSVIVNDGNGRFFEPGLGRAVSAGIELTRRF